MNSSMCCWSSNIISVPTIFLCLIRIRYRSACEYNVFLPDCVCNSLLTFDHHHNYIWKHSAFHKTSVDIWNTLYHFRKYIQCHILKFNKRRFYETFLNISPIIATLTITTFNSVQRIRKKNDKIKQQLTFLMVSISSTKKKTKIKVLRILFF